MRLQVHGDVFRPPKHLEVLAALIGTGVQLALLVLSVILITIAGGRWVGRGAASQGRPPPRPGHPCGRVGRATASALWAGLQGRVREGGRHGNVVRHVAAPTRLLVLPSFGSTRLPLPLRLSRKAPPALARRPQAPCLWSAAPL